MRGILNEFINNFIVQRGRKHKILTALVVLALVVTTGVFLRLKLIGISMTYEPTVGGYGGLTDPLETINNSLNGGDYGDGKGFTVNLYDYTVSDIITTDFDTNFALRNDGINAGHALHFLPNGANFDTNNYPTQSNPYMTPEHYTGADIALQGIVQKNLVDGYPALSADATQHMGYDSTDPLRTESLRYLFVPGPNVTEYQDVTGLFRQAGNWIEFDSSKHYAYFLPASQNTKGKNQFGVDSTTLYKSNGEAVGFFPFDAKDPAKTDVNANRGYSHHFGLTMTADFTIYEGRMINGQDMEFRFDGDDDLWVFVDGVLVLDIGGIHRPLGGSINFTQGTVTVEKAAQVNCGAGEMGDDNSPLPDVYEDTPQVRQLSDIFGVANYTANFKEGTSHKLKVFYLERGGVNSNLKITTNIFERQHVIVKKKWNDKGATVDHSAQKIGYELYRVNRKTGVETKIDNIEQYMSKPPKSPEDPAGILNASKGWEEVIDRLPVSGENNEMFYYTVKETTFIPGYKVEIPAPEHTDMPPIPDEKDTIWYPQLYSTGYTLQNLNAPSALWNTVYDSSTGNLDFNRQYAQAFFTIPAEIKSQKLAGVQVVLAGGGSDPSKLALKFCAADSSHTELEHSYGSSLLSVGTTDPATIDELCFMSLAEGNSNYTISAVNYLTVDGVIFTQTFNEDEVFDRLDLNGCSSNSTHGLRLPEQYSEVKMSMPTPYITLGNIQSIKTDFAYATGNLTFKIYSGSDQVTQRYDVNTGNSFTWTPTGTARTALNNRASDSFTQFGIMAHNDLVDTKITGVTVKYNGSTQVSNPFPKPMVSGFNIKDYGDIFTITNTKLDNATISVEKKWFDLFGNDVEPDDSDDVRIDLLRYRTLLTSTNELDGDPELDTSYTNYLVLTKADNYKDKFTDLDTTGTVGGKNYAYTYAVKEHAEDAEHKVTFTKGEFVASYDNGGEPIVDGTIKITNTWQDINPDNIDINVEKIWTNYSDVVMNAPEPVTAVLTRQRQLITVLPDGTKDYGAAEADTAFVREVVLGTAPGDLSKSFGSYPLNAKDSDDGNLYKYTYYVAEKESNAGIFVSTAGDNYSVTVDQVDNVTDSTFTITNKCQTHYAAPGDATIAIQKTIDNLLIANKNTSDETRDNQDTDVMGGASSSDDLYRLYLDIQSYAKETPIDLLIVVDQSGNMYDRNDINFGGQANQYRDMVISSILNGHAEVTNVSKRTANPDFADFNPDNYHDLSSSVTKDSLVNMFLSLNAQNQVAVVGFNGDRYKNKPAEESALAAYVGTYPYPVSAGYNYTKDSTIIRNWSATPLSGAGLNVEGMKNTGANYEAGLMRAAELLRDTDIQNNGHKKIMVFIGSDVPSCYIADTDPYDRVGNTLTNHSGNEDACRQPSIDAFSEFVKEFPMVSVFSIGFSGDLSASGEVLNQYVNIGGDYFYAGDNGNQLRTKLMSVLIPETPGETVITDALSINVEYYETDPDIIVTMKTRGTNETPVVIWKNGAAVAGAGQFAYVDNSIKDIVKSVTYTPTSTNPVSTGTVQVVFDEMYKLSLNQVYTVSYNVQVTKDAYAYYLAIENYPDTGDLLTDYSRDGFVNATSSGQPGFNANSLAQASYRFEGEPTHTDTYKHPVVQITTTDISVEKKWYKTDGIEELPFPHLPVQVQLYRTATPIVASPPVPVPIEELVSGEVVTLFTGHMSDSFNNLPVKGYDSLSDTFYSYEYYVKEVVPADVDYVVSYSLGTDKGEPDADGHVVVKNTLTPDAGYTLPVTGGRGVMPNIIGGILVMMAGLLISYICKCKRERRFEA